MRGNLELHTSELRLKAAAAAGEDGDAARAVGANPGLRDEREHVIGAVSGPVLNRRGCRPHRETKRSQRPQGSARPSLEHADALQRNGHHDALACKLDFADAREAAGKNREVGGGLEARALMDKEAEIAQMVVEGSKVESDEVSVAVQVQVVGEQIKGAEADRRDRLSLRKGSSGIVPEERDSAGRRPPGVLIQDGEIQISVEINVERPRGLNAGGRDLDRSPDRVLRAGGGAQKDDLAGFEARDDQLGLEVPVEVGGLERPRKGRKRDVVRRGEASASEALDDREAVSIAVHGDDVRVAVQIEVE